MMRVMKLVSESEQLVRDGKISRDDYPAYLRREVEERMKREVLEEKEKDPRQE